jgi:hypothetical protein
MNIKNVDLSDMERDQRLISEGINESIPLIKNLLTTYSKNNHRFKSRTGKLQNAIESNTINNKVQLLINNTKAKYGSYIHDGTKYITADPFIDNAILNNETAIERIIIESIDRKLQNVS